MKLCSQQVIHEITLSRILLIHSLVFEYYIWRKRSGPKLGRNVHQPSSQRFLTWNVPGTVVFTPAGVFWPRAAARLSNGLPVAISASREAASLADWSRSILAFSSARSRLIFSSSRSSSAVSSSSSSESSSLFFFGWSASITWLERESVFYLSSSSFASLPSSSSSSLSNSKASCRSLLRLFDSSSTGTGASSIPNGGLPSAFLFLFLASCSAASNSARKSRFLTSSVDVWPTWLYVELVYIVFKSEF